MPAPLEQLEAGKGADAWDDLWDALGLEGQTVVPASFAALPTLVVVGTKSPEALSLAGAIMRGALQDHGADDLLQSCTEAVRQLQNLLDQRLKSRPADYLHAFRDLLATTGQYHWIPMECCTRRLLGGLLRPAAVTARADDWLLARLRILVLGKGFDARFAVHRW
ncbi:hypothetical protein [Streptomyces sp. NPDC096013]|uniref:hypothetical protein n=1 Tax=Streptomyces sp. NPDC096013 TaxID=3366069 RepID=UPI0037F23DA3